MPVLKGKFGLAVFLLLCLGHSGVSQAASSLLCGAWEAYVEGFDENRRDSLSFNLPGTVQAVRTVAFPAMPQALEGLFQRKGEEQRENLRSYNRLYQRYLGQKEFLRKRHSESFISANGLWKDEKGIIGTVEKGESLAFEVGREGGCVDEVYHEMSRKIQEANRKLLKTKQAIANQCYASQDQSRVTLTQLNSVIQKMTFESPESAGVVMERELEEVRETLFNAKRGAGQAFASAKCNSPQSATGEHNQSQPVSYLTIVGAPSLVNPAN